MAQQGEPPRATSAPLRVVDELLTVAEMSERTGVAASALRFYEQLGLIAAVRTPGNQRRYARHMIRRVSLEERRLSIERLERELTGCIGCGCLSMKACALLNPDNALGNAGAGARRLD